jgi:Tfp pilus assembly protein PilF
MSLLMKALKKAERGPQSNASPDWGLEPMEPRGGGSNASGAMRGAQAAAGLILEQEGSSERNRLAFLLGLLLLVVVGMGTYFYIAIYYPRLLLSTPAPQPSPVVAPAPATQSEAAALPAEMSPIKMEPAPLGAKVEPPVTPAVTPPAERPTPAFRPPSESAPAPRIATPGNDDRALRITSGHPPAGSEAAFGGLQEAYRLLQEGRYDAARQAYERLRVTDPNNIDVILGLASIAQRQGRNSDAAESYLRALEVEPRNTFAQAGLITMIGKADPVAAEAKLRQLIGQQPAAYLYLALGNVYAGQNRWSEAQSAYFEAQRLAPDSPDYAFNLAVSLEHIGQPRAATEYYQRALQLARGRSAFHFDPAQVRSRLQKLSQ